MKLLLDTHVLIWYITADPLLSSRFLAAIRDPANEVFLSAASTWEAIVKYALGKLPLPAPPSIYFAQQRIAHGIASLVIDEGAFPHLAALPNHHRDPFDRIMIAQSLQHQMIFLTNDSDVLAYPILCLP